MAGGGRIASISANNLILIGSRSGAFSRSAPATASLDQFRSYSWPGNIRELQNVIERSMILCETHSFSVDENWLTHESTVGEKANHSLGQKLANDEKVLIERVLDGARGRVSGRSGAAVKLGLPASTLESKIRSLQINKHAFRIV
jgi:DNA-binding NtrC family response regulator